MTDRRVTACGTWIQKVGHHEDGTVFHYATKALGCELPIDPATLPAEPEPVVITDHLFDYLFR